MGQSKRFQDHFDDRRAELVANQLPQMSPYTLPMQAFGPVDMVQYRPHLPVWAWLQWPDGQLTRTPCEAVMSNDRVVLVNWERGSALSRSVFVWRQAVTHRAERSS